MVLVTLIPAHFRICKNVPELSLSPSELSLGNIMHQELEVGFLRT